MKEEIGGTRGTSFTERKTNKHHHHKDICNNCLQISDLYKEEEIKIFSISTVGSKRSIEAYECGRQTPIRNDTDVTDDALKEEEKGKKRWLLRLYFSLTLYGLISVKK